MVGMDLALTEFRFAANSGVRLHYRATGQGPLLLFLHGIPGFWNSWHHQLAAFGTNARVAAMDLRGFNQSDQPTDVRAYRLIELIGDVVCVLRDLGGTPATLIGHDWGALIAWWVAITHPRLIERLAVLAAPHPLCYLAARQAGDLIYSPNFREQLLDAASGAAFDADRISAVTSDPAARAELKAALLRSNPEAIRNYYRANLPPQRIDRVAPVEAPTLILYGTEDRFIPARYYDLSAAQVAAHCEIVAIPEAGHFLHVEAAEQVTAALAQWLDKPAAGPGT
jgi:pimeloyl-ACP methyl ester carboxylesterase